MAKQSSGKGGNAHIRLIVLDAVIPEGDVGQIAQALQNALRPPAQPRPPAPPQITHADNATSANDTASEDAYAEEIVEDSPVPRQSREPKPRKFSTPDMIEFDAEQVASWKKFASAKVPKSDQDRYMLVAAWYKDSGDEDGVTSDHVFSCFRHMKWSVGIKDFGAPMRALKKINHLRSVGPGKFVITQLGLNRIDEMAEAHGSE